jgi:hypothetical protein
MRGLEDINYLNARAAAKASVQRQLVEDLPRRARRIAAQTHLSKGERNRLITELYKGANRG